MVQTKSPLKSKTIIGNSALFAVYTIAKWAFPDFSIPEDVLVALVTIGNLLLRLSTHTELRNGPDPGEIVPGPLPR